MDRRRGMRFLASLLLFLSAASGVEAQCAMCGSAAPYAGSSPERSAAGLAVGALVLLLPVFALLAALAVYLRRQSAEPADEAAAPEAPAGGPVDGAAAGRVLSWSHATSPGEAGP